MSVQALRRESPSVTIEQLRASLELERAAFMRDGPPSYRTRRHHLQLLLGMILDHQDRIIEAIGEDFGTRSPDESRRIELLPLILGIRHTIKSLRRWMRPSRRSTHWATWPSLARVDYVPLGVVGIISPWNYPVSLALGPLTGALAAGNRAMIKPSELTPRTSAVLAELISKTFAADHVSVATGGVEIAQAFSSLPFDHLLFTGSTGVGRLVMRAASEHLVPVTLELGGKSPALIDRAFPFDKGVSSLMLGKLYNAGQTCIAPDYLLVHESRVDEVVERVRAEVANMYPRLADNRDYSSLINTRHRERLLGYLDDAREKGATVLEINPGDEASERFAEANKLALTLLLDVDDSMTVMQEEIFGPLLPIKTYADLDEAIDYINAHPRPLAAYVYSDSRATVDHFGARVVSGALSINATAVHFAQDELPFGGVGASGMGCYHGFDGFETFSHKKAVYRQLRPNLMHLVTPPYEGALKDRLIQFFLGK
ncbi:Coniferyl aldehyde dehydrogenase [Enhygromyxa salina]|uniref:Aldehyde dehydrogenase n=1 Tax=Enhygromyxa salina TaxID=215803 RepID=A0A2S9YCS5_9BACT|nr:coniferyl aldehyde dehydrogenase [Enhygromyxa salina]PRQ02893.1 Coniferyl aldehyde dehydrogenase [Enhygromyxa salina]